MTNSVTKIKCRWCGKRFKPSARGRRPVYCSRSCRQRGYEKRTFADRVPTLLLGRDIDDIRTKDGIRRTVVEILRQLGFVKRSPSLIKPVSLRVIENPNPPDDDKK